MARVLFDTVKDGVPVTVVAGWDRPLREFFMHVESRAGEDAGEALWTDFAWGPAERQTMEPYKATLAKWGITPPEGFWDRVAERQGNVVHRHRADTGWEVQSW